MVEVLLCEQLIAAPDAPGLARRLLGSYLRHVAWSGPAQEVDLVLAVSEAVSNAAEHAYPDEDPGPVEMRAQVMTGPNGERRICVKVVDWGRWCDPPAGRRRNGLVLMRAACEHVTVRGDACGTRVTLISRAETAEVCPL